VPILKIIDETLAADRILSLRGVINGSTNFILSQLAEGASWKETLAEARVQGFLEADPTADLSGADAAHKLSILAFHAFGLHVPPERIETRGISEAVVDDILHARRTGRTVKLIAEALWCSGGLKLSVAPQSIPDDDSLARVTNEMNIIEVECEGVGTQQFIGKGAGSIPTANAVVSDLLDVLASRRYRRVQGERAALRPHEVERRAPWRGGAVAV
jgi:homoserine dehydrogenase